MTATFPNAESAERTAYLGLIEFLGLPLKPANETPADLKRLRREIKQYFIDQYNTDLTVRDDSGRHWAMMKTYGLLEQEQKLGRARHQLVLLYSKREAGVSHETAKMLAKVAGLPQIQALGCRIEWFRLAPQAPGVFEGHRLSRFLEAVEVCASA